MENIIATLTPALNARMLSAAQREAFEKGLNILTERGVAQSFVLDSRRFKDYHRRVRHLLTYLQTTPANGVTTPSLAKRRVGRPTKAEQAAYAEAKKRKAMEVAKASLFPDVKPDTTLQPLTYNGIIANPNGESIAATMPHLNQLRYFLSEDLNKRVNTVRDLRNEMASKAEQAKTMAEANERAIVTGTPVYSEEEIAALATRAVEIESDILPTIYNDVDREMGEVYLRLSLRTGDPEYIAKVSKDINIPTQDLRTQFKPFFEKALARDPHFADMVAEKIANDRPEVKAQRDAAAKHKAEADAIIKYIIRKDKPNTAKRIKGLQERIDTLRKDFSDIVTEEEIKGYEAILENAKENA